MHTQLDYLSNTYLLTGSGTVLEVGKNDSGTYIVLDRTLFHPQGGGQASDEGVIRTSRGELKVQSVRLHEGKVFHYTLSELPLPEPGEIVGCEIDKETRLKNACSHTAGHLIAQCVEKLEPAVKAIKAYHFLNGPYVEFSGQRQHFLEADQFAASLLSTIQNCIQQSPALSSNLVNGFRTVQVEGFEAVPCGGTHLKNLNEIKRLALTRVKNTKEGFRVSYMAEVES